VAAADGVDALPLNRSVERRNHNQGGNAMRSDTAGAPANTAGSSDLKPEEMALAMERLRSEQNLARGALLGAAGAAAGGALWALVTMLTKYQIGWMAVGVGFLVGLGLRVGGRGLDRIFGMMGAALSLLGCLVGNVLAGAASVATAQNLSFLDVLSRLKVGVAVDLLVATFSPMDIVFYGLAVYEGYRLSLRRVTMEEVKRVLGHSSSSPGTA
jgi:hypothetical protein